MGIKNIVGGLTVDNIPCTLQYSKGLEYILINNDSEYAVSGFGTCTDRDVVIPEIYNGLPVTTIADTGSSTQFTKYDGLRSISIPETITCIEPDVFDELTDVMFYCAVKSKPDGWDIEFPTHQVIWGMITDLNELNNKLPIHNTTYGRINVSFGYDTSAGALSWRISSYDITKPTQFTVYDPNQTLTDDVIDKIFGARIANNFDYWGKITAISRHDDVYVDVTVDTAIEDSGYDSTVGIDDLISDKNTLKIYDMISAGNVSTGNYSFAEGYSAEAQGMISHAEGYNTKAIGKYSHAEGHTTIAGYSSHAEGNRTKALGWNSHSEGSSTTAKGDASHTEGEATKTTGKASHAEGANTEATGWTSHAEGYQSKALHTAAHAEGKSTASGQYSHSEGNSSASADYAHSEGNGSSATNEGAHAENKATASGKYSHSEGAGIADAEYAHAENTAKAYATYSHAENSGTAYGYLSHAEGSGSTTGQSDYKNKTDTASEKFSGYAAHAEGSGTLARGAFSHAEGDGSKALSKSAHAEGSGSQATGWASHAEGANCTAAHSGSHAEGSGTKSQSEASHSEGLGTTAQGQASHAQGRYNVLNPVNDTYPTKGRYADIVGNGESASARSNAYTLDWLGNGWFAGDVRVGGTSYDDAKKLITIDDIQNNTEFIKKISDIILEEISSDEEEY